MVSRGPVITVALVVVGIGLWVLGHALLGESEKPLAVAPGSFNQARFDARQEVIDRVSGMTKSELTAFIAENEAKLMAQPKSALLPRAEEHQRQMTGLSEDVVTGSLKAFALGHYFLVRKDLREARRRFVLAASLADTPAVHLMIGYLHDKLGEPVAAKEELEVILAYAKRGGDEELAERGRTVIGTFATSRSALVGGSLLFAFGLSALIFIALLVFLWRSNKKRSGGGSWLNNWSSMRRITFLKKIQNASKDEFDAIEQEISAMGADEEWPALPLGSPLEEIRGLAYGGDRWEQAARSWLSAHFLVRLHSHRKALRYYHAAIDLVEGPLLNYMLARSFVTLKKETAAERAFQKAATLAGGMGQEKLRGKAEEWLKKLA